MPISPIARICLLAPLSLVAICARAQTAESCAEITDDRARLECYDRLYSPSREAIEPSEPPEAPAARTAPATKPAPEAEPGAGASPAAPPSESSSRPNPPPVADAASPPAAEPEGAAGSGESGATEENFGLSPKMREERERREGRAEPEEIRARILKVQKKPWGEHVLTLDNGQVWEQREVIWSLQFNEGDVVTIEKGLFSSYFLRHENAKRATKVRRLK